jgi:hypothetical protein
VRLGLLLVGQTALAGWHERDAIGVHLEANHLALGAVADPVDDRGLDPDRYERAGVAPR